jgi:hypothetical protein
LTLYKAHPKSAGDSSMEISSMYIWCEKNMESYCTPNCRWRLSFQLLESRKQKKHNFTHLRDPENQQHWIIHYPLVN